MIIISLNIMGETTPHLINILDIYDDKRIQTAGY
jgi:hypothetical protein